MINHYHPPNLFLNKEARRERVPFMDHSESSQEYKLFFLAFILDSFLLFNICSVEIDNERCNRLLYDSNAYVELINLLNYNKCLY